jgi:hypothetical protein
MTRAILFFLAALGASAVHAEEKEKEYIDIIEYEPAMMKVPTTSGMSNGSVMSIPAMKAETKKIEKSLFQKAIRDAIHELEGTLEDTCAKRMTVALKIDVSGKYAVAEIGIGGSVEVEILNPRLPKKCAK